MQDLIHAVGDVLLVGQDMSQDILDGPFPRNALQSHTAGIANAIQEQFKLISFLQELFY
jgi:hypothetical protein